MLRFLLTLSFFLLLFPCLVYSQIGLRPIEDDCLFCPPPPGPIDAGIWGPTTVNKNQQATYSTYVLGATHYSTSYYVYGGTTVSQSKSSITVRWTSVGTRRYIRASINTSQGWYIRYIYVNVINPAPAKPSNPYVKTRNCGNTVVERYNPPSGVTWYWQTSSSGTSTGNSSKTYTVYGTSRWVYLRARSSTGVWSTSSSSVYASVNSVPGQPTTPSVSSNTCGNKTLTRGTPPSGITWYWQGKSSGGTSTSNSSSTYTATSSGTYYIRARNNSTGCWSFPRSVSVTVNPAPSRPSAISVSTNTCGNKTLTRSNPPSGITWYWQGKSSNGTSRSNSNQTYSASSSGTYYLRARNNSTGCWSSSRSVSVTVNPNPSKPSTPSVVNNCGSSRLTRANPPSGFTWYWQGTNSGGKSTSNSNTTYTANSDGTYYIRARNNTTLCWSSSRGVAVNVNEIPGTPSTPTVSTNNCGNKILTRGNPPSGVTWYWQGKNSNGTSTSNSNSTYSASSSGTYYIRSRNNSSQCWGSSRSVGVTVNPPPAIPSISGITYDFNGATITRNNPPSGQTWYWQTSSGGTSQSNSSTTWLVSDDRDYYLRSRSSQGCWSNPLTISYEAQEPTSIDAVVNLDNSITISWSGVRGNETGFDISRATSSNGTYQLVGSLSSVRREFTDSNLADGTTYYYRVQAEVGSQKSTGLQITSATTKNPFVTTWKTDNPGTSGNNQITIPTFNFGYNYLVSWENTSGGQSGTEGPFTDDATLTFSVAGTYQVKIYGDFPQIYMNNQGDKSKLVSIDQWGDIQWRDMGRAFYGCDNLSIGATDVPDLSNVNNLTHTFANSTANPSNIGSWNVSGVSSMGNLFRDNPVFNQDISSWNVSNVTYMGFVFYNAQAFDQNLGNWNIEKVQSMHSMLALSGMSSDNYDATLIGWASQPQLKQNVSLNAYGVNYCSTEAQDARETLMNQWNWSIGGDIPGCGAITIPFITTWSTTNNGSSASSQISIPTDGDGYSYYVDWEDVSNSSVNGSEGPFEGNATITFPAEGTYQVSITGYFPRIKFGGVFNDSKKLLSIEQWGDNGWTTMEWAFDGCTNLVVNATDNPDLRGVRSMERMFYSAYNFNSPINSWDVSGVTDMESMFGFAYAFNQPLSTWDVNNVRNMRFMFARASSFDQDLSTWNLSNVDIAGMFSSAYGFNQNLATWDLSEVTGMDGVLYQTNLSLDNYDATLIGWAGQSNIPQGVQLNARNLRYCSGETARNTLLGTHGWAISDDQKYCGLATVPFITTWQTDRSGFTNDNQITIPAAGAGFDYMVDWVNLDNPTISGTSGPYYGRTVMTFPQPGRYELSITGAFPQIAFNERTSSTDHFKLQTIEQWGDNEWVNMWRAFTGCASLVINATDAPNLNRVTDLTEMLKGTSLIGSDVSHWEVSNVENMNGLFENCWFDSDISTWDVSNVTSMAEMFKSSRYFNQDISGWDVSGVSNMYEMFRSAGRFNQNISSWDMSSVSSTQSMFYYASAFDQDLGSWNLSNTVSMRDMLDRSGLSTANYDATLQGWASSGLIRNNVTLGAEQMTYCNSTTSRDQLIQNYGWQILDDANYCPITVPFVTTWKTDNTGTSATNQILIPVLASAGVYDYSVQWVDVNNPAITGSEGPFTGSALVDFPANGTYRVSITGSFPGIYFNNNGDAEKLLSVDQWGNNQWLTMTRAFMGCRNLDISTSDNPNLSEITQLEYTFAYCAVMDAPLGGWNTSTITDMDYMFLGADAFNQDISGWDVSNVTSMFDMFRGADLFNQNISSWDISNVRTIEGMFNGAASFNQDLSNWGNKIGNITDMSYMFYNASSFNQSLASWNIGNVGEFDYFIQGSGMSTANYDATLIAWAALPVLQRDVFIFGSSGLTFCDGRDARATLRNQHNWTFNGDRIGCPITVPFTTTWKTDNPGTSLDNQIVFGGSGNYFLEWEDVNDPTSNGVEGPFVGSATLTFPQAGTYQVKTTGLLSNFRVSSGNEEKIISIDQWGDNFWTSMHSTFRGCSNLELLATDNPRLDYVKFLDQMFNGATTLDADLGDWDISSIQYMRGMLDNTGLSRANYDATLDGWRTLVAGERIQYYVSFGAVGLNYCDGADSRNALISSYRWTITDAGEDCSTTPSANFNYDEIGSQDTETVDDNTEVVLSSSGLHAVDADFAIYPNPSSTFTYLSGDLIGKSIEVIDLNGKRTYFNEALQSNLLEINTTGFSEGLYVVRVLDGQQLIRQLKLVISD